MKKLFLCIVISCGGASVAAKDPANAPSGPAGSNSGDKNVAPNAVAQIECGDFHSCAMLGDGSVKCWGRNSHGTIGDVGPGDRLTPTAVPGVAALKQIGLGSTFSCGVTQDGHVQCWGSGRIFGDGKKVEKAKPALVPGIENVSEIAVSGVLICARGTDRSIKCWGTEKPLVTSKSADEVAVASAHVCTRAGKEIRCSGEDALGKLPALNMGNSIKQLVTGDAFACALEDSGSASCWGQNQRGELGTPPDMNLHDKPAAIPGLPPIARLSAGESQACAMLRDGGVRCWGNNSDGELGIGKKSDVETPTAVKIRGTVSELCMASLHACAHTEDGKVYCWGDNSGGQLGDGTEEARTSPVEVKF